MQTFNRIEIVEGDLTRQEIAAIVNAANSSLLGGGGVDGAIHRTAGPDLLAECRKIRQEELPDGLQTGEAVITRGYHLPAKFVIHTAGPIWRGGGFREAELLADCYRNCLQIALQNHLKDIAFPAISTGIYRFPKEPAAEIALRETLAFLAKNSVPEKVYFVVIGENVAVYRETFERLSAESATGA